MDEDDIFSFSVLLLVFLLIVLFFVGSSLINNVGGSHGQHSGYVTAIEYSDNLLFDATIVYFKSDMQSSQEDKYCVNDEDTINKLKTYSHLKTPVIIFYKNEFITWSWDCNGGDSIIYGVNIQYE